MPGSPAREHADRSRPSGVRTMVRSSGAGSHRSSHPALAVPRRGASRISCRGDPSLFGSVTAGRVMMFAVLVALLGLAGSVWRRRRGVPLARSRSRSREIVERLSAHIDTVPWPLAVGLLATVSGVGWYSLGRAAAVPRIFADELIYARAARAFAEGGNPLEHGYGFVAPLIDSSAYLLTGSDVTAYRLIQVINVAVMVSAAFPAYMLARRALSRRSTLAVSALTVIVPWMVYARFVMTEAAFYPVFLVFILALVRTLERPSLLRHLVLALALVLAVATRTQAIALVAAVVSAAPVYGFARRPRTSCPTSVHTDLDRLLHCGGSRRVGKCPSAWCVQCSPRRSLASSRAPHLDRGERHIAFPRARHPRCRRRPAWSSRIACPHRRAIRAGIRGRSRLVVPRSAPPGRRALGECLWAGHDPRAQPLLHRAARLHLRTRLGGTWVPAPAGGDNGHRGRHRRPRHLDARRSDHHALDRRSELQAVGGLPTRGAVGRGVDRAGRRNRDGHRASIADLVAADRQCCPGGDRRRGCE